MSEWSIALNRFGLGRRAGEALGSDPRAWLANQLVRFDPANIPAGFQPYTAAEVGRLRQTPLRTEAAALRARLVARFNTDQHE